MTNQNILDKWIPSPLPECCKAETIKTLESVEWGIKEDIGSISSAMANCDLTKEMSVKGDAEIEGLQRALHIVRVMIKIKKGEE